MEDWKNKTDNKASNTVVSKRNIDKGEVRSEKIEKVKKAEKISQSEHVNLVHKKDYMMPNSHIWFDKKGVDRMDRGACNKNSKFQQAADKAENHMVEKSDEMTGTV